MQSEEIEIERPTAAQSEAAPVSGPTEPPTVVVPGVAIVTSAGRSEDLVDGCLVALVVANLVPLAGVVLFDWSVFSLMLLFWLENIVTGVFTAARMALAQGTATPVRARGRSTGLFGQSADDGPVPPKPVAIALFCVHYGGFAFVHGIFVFSLFGGSIWSPTSSVGSVPASQIGVALAAMAAGHGVSFWKNYLQRGEYLVLSPVQIMQQPYVRVVVLHVTIIFGGFVAGLLGSPVWALAMLVLLKTGADAVGYVRRRSTGLSAP